jgi:ankyrin repeat protein
VTERQQLAFLLEATSTRESTDNENESTFTKIATRKKAKRNGKCVNPRVYRRNERGETLLHVAAIKGDVASLKKLIKDGADVSLKDYAGS